MLNVEGWNTYVSKSEVNATWNWLNCSVDEVCNYIGDKQGKTQPVRFWQ
jgi:hypothetical protein